MLIPFLLVIATMSQARPIGPFIRQVGPPAPSDSLQPIPSFETLPELSGLPLPSFETSANVEPSAPEFTAEPTDLPSIFPSPPTVSDIFETPTPEETEEPLFPTREPEGGRGLAVSLSPSPSPSISASSTPSVTPSPSNVATVTVTETPRVTDTAEISETPDPPAETTGGPEAPFSPPEVVMSQRTPCFPASATVQVSDGSVKRMQDLSIGDEVHVGGSRYSPIHMFTHRVHDTWEVFVRLTTSSGRILKATGGHFVYVGDVLRPARDVRVGDALQTAEGTWTTVIAVHEVIERGLYNPQTTVGDIIVDGIRASVYTEAVEPSIAHAALLPLRVAFSMFGLSTQCGEHGYPEIVPHALRNMVASAS